MTCVLYKMTVHGAAPTATRSRLQTFFRYFPVSDRDRRWGLYLTTAGESRIPPRFPYPPPATPAATSSTGARAGSSTSTRSSTSPRGQGRLEMRRQQWRIGAGTVFLLHPGVWHRYRPDPATGWSEHWVGCDGPVVRGLVRQGFFSPRRPGAAGARRGPAARGLQHRDGRDPRGPPGAPAGRGGSHLVHIGPLVLGPPAGTGGPPAGQPRHPRGHAPDGGPRPGHRPPSEPGPQAWA